MSVVLVCLLVCLGSESLFDVLPWLIVVLVCVLVVVAMASVVSAAGSAAGALVSAGFGVAGLVVCFWSLERRIWYADCWLLGVVVSDGDGMLLADCLLCC